MSRKGRCSLWLTLCMPWPTLCTTCTRIYVPIILAFVHKWSPQMGRLCSSTYAMPASMVGETLYKFTHYIKLSLLNYMLTVNIRYIWACVFLPSVFWYHKRISSLMSYFQMPPQRKASWRPKNGLEVWSRVCAVVLHQVKTCPSTKADGPGEKSLQSRCTW